MNSDATNAGTSVIGGAFVALTELLVDQRPRLWKWWYDTLATKDRADDLLFMNYGYVDEAPGPRLDPADERFRSSIQLYAHVVSGLDLAGRDVVEVGCGRGGGGSFFARYAAPRSYIGIDLSPAAIASARRTCDVPAVRWIQGSADQLEIGDATADIVVNVESSHCYPSMEAFVAEVTRILRPGGYFAFCDVRIERRVALLRETLLSTGLCETRYQDISPQVVRALDTISERRELQIKSRVPPLLQRAFRDFAGVRGSILHRMLSSGQMRYLSWQLRKPVESR